MGLALERQGPVRVPCYCHRARRLERTVFTYVVLFSLISASLLYSLGEFPVLNATGQTIDPVALAAVSNSTERHYSKATTDVAETGNSPDLAVQSTHILSGAVKDVKSYWDEDKALIYSVTTLTPSHVLKGLIQSPDVVVRTLGGHVRDQEGGAAHMIAEGQAEFTVGEEVMVFLQENQEGPFSIVGGPFGKVLIKSSGMVSNIGFGGTVEPGFISGYNYALGRRWETAEIGIPIEYSINQQGTADTTNEFAAVNSAFQTWEDDPISTIDFTYLGTTTRGWAKDGYKTVDWGTNFAACPTIDTLGCEYARAIYYEDIFGNIVETDMRFNDNLLWSDSGGVPGQSVDVQNITSHEAGHWLHLDHVVGADAEQTMYEGSQSGETKKRSLEWGDLAGLRFIYPVTSSAPDWFGDETQGTDVAIRDIDRNGLVDVVMLWVDNPGGANTIYYKVGWNIDSNGGVCPTCWSSQKAVGGTDGVGDSTSGAGVALSDLDSNGILDMIVFWIDAPSGSDVMYYRIGWNINTSGDIASWNLKKTVGGGGIGNDTSGGGATLVNLDSNIRPELVVTWIDNPSGGNNMFYRIGWNINTAGNAASWSLNKNGPASIGDESDGAGVAAAVWFTDEFSENIGRQWQSQAGTWNLESGELSGEGASARIITTKTFPSNRTFQVRMKTIAAGPSSWNTAWVIGKYDDECSRSTLVLHTTGVLEFNVAVGCTKTTWTASTVLSVYLWHTVKMLYVGNNAKVYVDNVLYFDVTDSKFGQLGDSNVQLASWGPSHSHFDDAMVDDSTGKPDLVFSWVDDPPGNNQVYYKVAWNTDTSGNPGSWSGPKWTPGKGFGSYVGIGFQTQGTGVAVADINNNGFLELVFAWMDNPQFANHATFRIEWEGRVDSHQL